MPNDRNRPASERTTHAPNIDDRMKRLEEAFILLAHTGTLENTFGHGFDAVSGHLCGVTEQLGRIARELQPLRQLRGGDPVELSDAEQASLDNLLAAQARPSFRDVKVLPLQSVSPRFASDLLQLPSSDHAIDPMSEDPTWSAAS